MMNLLRTLVVALRALLRNKLRSFLTALGVVIGVGAVIAMVAIGEGAKSRIATTFSSMGSSMIIVLSGSTTSGGVQGGFGTQPTITWSDWRAIQSELPSVKYAAPAMQSRAQVISNQQNWTTSVGGTTADLFAIRDWKTSRGSLFGQSETESSAKVVVLGQTVVDKLFGAGSDPTGLSVRINNIPFVVTGVLERKGQSPIGTDYDDVAYIPYTTYRSKLQGGLGNYVPGVIIVGATSTEATARAEREIAGLLRERHHIGPGTDDDFSIRNLTEIAGAMEQGTRTLTTLLAAIAAVSLLVGGIGIMNIMLVSVTERTREIGLRMAVGAKPRNILMQFLIESLTLSLMGGLLGVALGLSAAAMLAHRFGWSTQLNPGIMVVAVGFSAAVGIGFGLYPARKAARLDPIEALRFE